MVWTRQHIVHGLFDTAKQVFLVVDVALDSVLRRGANLNNFSLKFLQIAFVTFSTQRNAFADPVISRKNVAINAKTEAQFGFAERLVTLEGFYDLLDNTRLSRSTTDSCDVRLHGRSPVNEEKNVHMLQAF